MGLKWQVFIFGDQKSYNLLLDITVGVNIHVHDTVHVHVFPSCNQEHVLYTDNPIHIVQYRI